MKTVEVIYCPVCKRVHEEMSMGVVLPPLIVERHINRTNGSVTCYKDCINIKEDQVTASYKSIYCSKCDSRNVIVISIDFRLFKKLPTKYTYRTRQARFVGSERLNCSLSELLSHEAALTKDQKILLTSLILKEEV